MHRPQTPPPPPEWDPSFALDEDLPEYTPHTHYDPERVRRESISRALWEEHRRHEVALAHATYTDRLERQRTRESSTSQRGGVLNAWIRWSAKFYMPLMSRWGEHRVRAS